MCYQISLLPFLSGVLKSEKLKTFTKLITTLALDDQEVYVFHLDFNMPDVEIDACKQAWNYTTKDGTIM